MADIEWLVANKPPGSVVLLDEAYIHCSDDYHRLARRRWTV